MKILVTPTSFTPQKKNAATRALTEFADEIIWNPHGRPLREEELGPLLQDCDGYIAGLDYVTGQVIDSCKGLRVISRYGAGCDRVDLARAKAAGIAVCNTPGANANAVADLTMALLLSVARRIPLLDRSVRKGEWLRSQGTELPGKTIGIVGFGAIGRLVARRAAGFGMRVRFYDPFPDLGYAEKNGAESVSLEELIGSSDVISLHLPLNDETRHLIGKRELDRMRPGCILINTARGGLLDEAATAQALATGHIGGLGLDVYEEEPPSHSPLFDMDNVVLTPHTASHTREAAEAMAEAAVKNLIDVLSGRQCAHIVNG